MDKSGFLSEKVEPIDLDEVCSVGAIAKAFERTSFQSRNLAHCVKVYEDMLSEDNITIFLGISGAMVPAGMRKVISKMIRVGMVDVVVSTGANLYHDLFEALGFYHYLGNCSVDDKLLAKYRIDRIYDTYADDNDFIVLDEILYDIIEQMEPTTYSTREFFHLLGAHIKERQSIVRTCYEMEVPVFCPTIHDSGIGIVLTKYYEKGGGLNVDLLRDNYEILQISLKSENTGAVYIGGGVPKNYIQQISPMRHILGYEEKGHKYAIQITTDDPKWGGLSGCTLSESVSWKKLLEHSKNATVYMDATIGLPLIAKAVIENVGDELSNRKRARFEWARDKLISLTYG
jgi:deoxyhypusine synthase